MRGKVDLWHKGHWHCFPLKGPACLSLVCHVYYHVLPKGVAAQTQTCSQLSYVTHSLFWFYFLTCGTFLWHHGDSRWGGRAFSFMFKHCFSCSLLHWRRTPFFPFHFHSPICRKKSKPFLTIFWQSYVHALKMTLMSCCFSPSTAYFICSQTLFLRKRWIYDNSPLWWVAEQGAVCSREYTDITELLKPWLQDPNAHVTFYAVWSSLAMKGMS